MNELQKALARLNAEQRRAVLEPGHAVVLAGPGSGKTETLAVKVSMLLDQVQAPRGVACLTYSNDAVREFSTRIRKLGGRAGSRLFLGTVHSFCFTQVLRPFAALFLRPDLADRTVLSPVAKDILIERSLNQNGDPDQARYFEPTLTTIRRAIVCGEDLSRFDERHVATARYYDNELATQGMIDFEGMTLEALSLVREHASLRDLLVSRYPMLVLDEYQDLGGPLHMLILALRQAGAVIFAVGDPDQCVLGFTGADPRYLAGLAQDLNVNPIALRFNYRAGPTLIAASQGLLEGARGYEASPDREDPGTIVVEEVIGGLEEQVAHLIATTIPELLASGTPPHEIAILYRGRGQLYDTIEHQLSLSGLPHLLERDGRFPDGPIVKWLQHCATRALQPTAPDTDEFVDLFQPYEQLRRAADAGREQSLDDEIQLLTALDAPADPDSPLWRWVEEFDDAVDLSALLAKDGGRPDDEAAVSSLKEPPPEANDPVTLADFAGGVQMHGRLVVTTYHGSKGRQFDAVLLPGLQETILPSTRWSRTSRRYEISERALAEERRLFYVGLTRARNVAVICYSNVFTNAYGYPVEEGRSRFLDEIEARLQP